MNPPPRWIRRGFIDPLWPVLVVIGELLLGIVIVVMSLLAAFTPRRRLLRLALGLAYYLIVNLGILLRCFGWWLRHPLIGRRDRGAWHTIHSRMLSDALDRLLHAAQALFGFQVVVNGRLDVPPGRPLIVLARHAGPGDSFALVHLIGHQLQRNPRVVLKRVLQWDPGLDVILSRLDSYFLPSHSGAGEDRVAAVARLAGGLGPEDALLLFPEGANWTPRRHRRAVVELRREGHALEAVEAAHHPHVLPPRPAGTAAALAARPDADVLVLATEGLDELVNPGQVWRALPLHHHPMRIRPWLFPADTVPRESVPVEAWLDQQWATIDDWVDTAHHRG